jgi:hypothetical protein
LLYALISIVFVARTAPLCGMSRLPVRHERAKLRCDVRKTQM